MNNKLEILLNELVDEKYHTAHELANSVNVSEKTVRLRIKELNEILCSHGGTVTSKSNMGYKLTILCQDKFHNFFDCSHKEKRPTTSTERVPYILAVLLYEKGYIKIDDLCERFYVSRNTMSADLKKVEYILNIHHLTLKRRPNYGLLIKGSEFDKRRCIATSLIKHNNFIDPDGTKQKKLTILANIILDSVHKYNLHISEVSLEDITFHFYISINRASMDFPVVIDNDKIVKQVKEEVRKATEDIILRIQETIHGYFSESEVAYLILHMGAKLSSSAYKNQESNLVISRKIDELSSCMLEMIQQSFNIDFRNNLELRMSLNQHMVPLDIRMQYGIPLSNPLLHEIKKGYAFAYTMAATACITLSEHYHTSIPEDEIGYLAIIFELALEQKDKKVDKKNIVMVCASGKGTTQLFMYKYTRAFGKYINNIYECTAYELEYFDLVGKEIDYIFTTVPISLNVPVPVFEVNLFLEDKDIVAYREIFETINNSFLSEFYYRQLFLTGIKATTKEEIIKILCQHTDKHFQLPAEFYNAVMKREAMGQTDFGNLVAIPHPFQVMTKQNFVTVGILEKPIWWGNKEVQVVFLISISSDEHVDAEQFYQLTTRLLFDAKSIQYLIDNPRFDVLMSLLGGA